MRRSNTIDGCTVAARADLPGGRAVVLLVAPSGVLKTGLVHNGSLSRVHTHTRRSAAHEDFRHRCWEGA